MNITRKEMDSLLSLVLKYGLNLDVYFDKKGIKINVIKHDNNGVENHFRYAEGDNVKGGFSDHRHLFKNCSSMDDLVTELDIELLNNNTIELPKQESYINHSEPILGVIMASLFNKTTVCLTFNKEFGNEFQLTF